MVPFLVWDHSPFIYTSDFISIRYYSVLFAAGLLFLLFRLIKDLSLNMDKEFIESSFFSLVFFMLLGSRIFHCLFYEYGYYSTNLLEILIPFRLSPLHFTGYQGLSSHGGFLGAALYLFLFFRKKVSPIIFFKFLDSILLNSLIFASLVRIGNFYNSEIIGKPCLYLFCLAFPSSGYGLFPRHPVQLYEAFIYLITFLSILFYKHRASISIGKVSLYVVTVAGIMRFSLEFFKETQSDIVLIFLNMGQFLSIVSYSIFITVFIYLYRNLNNEKN
jgi:phosphatidylglycerol:prolipoprotein diacylglycerol transferase